MSYILPPNVVPQCRACRDLIILCSSALSGTRAVLSLVNYKAVREDLL